MKDQWCQTPLVAIPWDRRRLGVSGRLFGDDADKCHGTFAGGVWAITIKMSFRTAVRGPRRGRTLWQMRWSPIPSSCPRSVMRHA
jgi:hypothetical protein